VFLHLLFSEGLLAESLIGSAIRVDKSGKGKEPDPSNTEELQVLVTGDNDEDVDKVRRICM
jgi:hypothetical protein